MPDERISTLNGAGGDGGSNPNSAPEGGDSSIPEGDSDFISTVELVVPDDHSGEGKETPTGEEGDKPKDGEPTGEEPKGDETRYDKDPAWQRILKERDEANERVQRLEAKVDQLTTSIIGGKKDEGTAPKTILDMDDDEIRDLMDDDPKGFVENLAKQIQGEVFGELQTKSEIEGRQQAVISEIDSFAEEHKDFDPMWDRGEIQDFIKQHPGHNAISAYLSIKSKDFVPKDEHERIVKQEIEKDRANRGHKQMASVQGAGGGRSLAPHAASPELKDTKSGGGRTSVLLNRLRQRRAQAG